MNRSGLADALSRVAGVALGDVQVITTVVHSGSAVEEGKIQEW